MRLCLSTTCTRVALVMAVAGLTAVEVLAQGSGHLVYRIDQESSWIKYSGDWSDGPSEEVFGRFRLHFDGDTVSFEDIDTGANPPSYAGYLPDYPGSLSLHHYTWWMAGQDPDNEYNEFEGGFYAIYAELLQLTGGCAHTGPWGNGYLIVAEAEPLVISPLMPMAREPFQALVSWHGYSDRPIAASGSVVVDRDTVLVYGDVEVDGSFVPSFDPTDANLYSFTVDVPPLSAGRYHARYLVRHILSGEPQSDYAQVGPDIQFTVQGNIPTTGLAGRLLLVLVLILSGALLLHSRTTL